MQLHQERRALVSEVLRIPADEAEHPSVVVVEAEADC